MQNKSIYAPKDFMNNEETYFEMFTDWINTLNHELENKAYYDLIGHLYEDNVQSKGKQKNLQQYFTPQNVTEVMSALVMDKKVEEYESGFASDPCCGSGRFLLAAHYSSKGNLYCIGNDIDETSVKMGVLNFYSHGVRGSVLHMDSLEETFYKGWRVNRWLHHGIPVPHIEEITNINEAYNFFDVNKNKVQANNTNKVKVSESINNEVKISKPATGQTTLF